MKKNEWIYREITYSCIENRQFKQTQLALAKKLGISISTVNNALAPLEAMGAIIKMPRGFRIVDLKKIILYWATRRNLKKDIVYQTRVELPIEQIERGLPSSIIYAAYTAYKFRFEDVPADYDEVYVYANEKTLTEIKTRFPEKSGPPNLIVLKADEHLKDTVKNGICSLANMFVDFWNIKSWNAREFLQAVEKKIDEVTQ